jgi:phosphinothricin acetyltransferase
MNIRDAALTDADAICRIYNRHVFDTIVTFEEVQVYPAEMASRIADVTADFPWLVIEEDGAIVGYAYAAKHRLRSAYRFSVESTIYLKDDVARRGLGTALYRALLARLPRHGVHVVLGGIALPNAASVALHEKCGFRKVAHFEEVGFKFGRWIDVGYWQLTL